MSAIGKARASLPNGFTLIEMLVVLGIAGLVAGVFFPALYRAQGRLVFEQTATKAVGAVRGARADAIRSGRVVSIGLRPGSNSLLTAGGAVDFPEDVAVELQPRQLAFFPDGSSSGGRIVLASNAVRRTLTVDAGTGVLSVASR